MKIEKRPKNFRHCNISNEHRDNAMNLFRFNRVNCFVFRVYPCYDTLYLSHPSDDRSVVIP
jgi:hypothetical protein